MGERSGAARDPARDDFLEDFRVTTPCHLSLFTFQFTPPGVDPEQASEELLRRINDDGRIYLTQTRHEGRFVIRFQVGQFDCERDDVLCAVDVLREMASAQRRTAVGEQIGSSPG